MRVRVCVILFINECSTRGHATILGTIQPFSPIQKRCSTCGSQIFFGIMFLQIFCSYLYKRCINPLRNIIEIHLPSIHCTSPDDGFENGMYVR